MARTIKPVDLSTRTARARMKPLQEEPRWNALVAGKIHIGYQRRPGEKVGRWVLRTRRAGRYSSLTFAVADDREESDGVGTLSFDEAKQRALELGGAERVAGSPTVARIFEDYLRNLRERGKSTAVATTASRYILPALGEVPVAELSTSLLQSWLASVAAVSVRHGKPVVGDEAVRRRRNSANRIAAAFIAALNLALRRKKVSSDAAWRDLEKFEDVDVPRSTYLTIAESLRLLNSCGPDLRNLVRGALETGCRFAELAALLVGDFNPDVGLLAIRKSKTHRSRHVVLTPEGGEFIQALCAGRSGDARMFLRADGGVWKHTNLARPMDAAVARAKIGRITFHGLRHTYASLSVMNGMPLLVLAKNLGHTSTRMVEKVYGHLSDSYLAAEIRRGAPRFGIDVVSNVRPLLRGKVKG